MEKMLALLRELIESKSVPTVFKAVLFLVLVALGMSSAGFPVVEYAERLAVKLWEYPRLVGGLIGTVVAGTVVQLSRPLLQVAAKSARATLKNEKLKVSDRVILVFSMYLMVFLVIVLVVVFLITFLAWAVS